MKANQCDILLVEDDDGDAELFMIAINGAIVNRVHRADDGQSAMDTLDEYKNGTKPKPGLIFLDLNLPVVDGRDILKSIKTDDQLKTIPVIVMTTSRAERDVIQSYGDHANCFITKPLDYNEFVKVIKSLQNTWLEVVTLPNTKY